MSKSHDPRPPRASNVARGMILAGTGKKQVFGDRRRKRSKDAKRSWQRDHQENG